MKKLSILLLACSAAFAQQRVIVTSGAVTATTNADGTTGSAVPAKGVLVQGSDGTNARNISTTTGGVVKVDLSGTASNSTAVKVDGSAVTQPVSGTVTANAGSGTLTVSDTATAATAGAVPARALYSGAVSTGNLAGIIQCDSSALLNMSTATTTQIVALTSAQVIYVCSFSIVAGGTANVKLVRGTGSNCGTGTTDLSSNMPFIANTGIARGAGIGTVFQVTSANALCVTSSAAVTVAVDVSYTKF